MGHLTLRLGSLLLLRLPLQLASGLTESLQFTAVCVCIHVVVVK